MSALFAGLAGLVCGVFSGLGIGGGTLLMVWMTAVVGLEQQAAQGINLLYFLPTAACALFFHIKNRLIRWRVVLPAIATGCLVAAVAAFLATAMDTGLLRKLFGGFLILVGIRELFTAQRRARKDK
ncbi:MAG: sulfite exporter TauE/SafE family protein [Oscillospiraceae bacterium]|nr:sulfite exporter TauE/SafE family protein [Oscillospiraceae bacterium]